MAKISITIKGFDHNERPVEITVKAPVPDAPLFTEKLSDLTKTLTRSILKALKQLNKKADAERAKA